MLQEWLPQGTAPSRWTIQCACRVIPVHGSWAALILSSWSSRGHLVGWALALGFFMKKDGSAWAQFCLLGLRSIFGIFVCGTRGEIQRDQRNPEPNVVGGEGARQEDATLRSSHRQMRVAWAGTERG